MIVFPDNLEGVLLQYKAEHFSEEICSYIGGLLALKFSYALHTIVIPSSCGIFV